MTLPKHLRPRWRYLALDIRCWPDDDLTRTGVQQAFHRSARSLLGDVGDVQTELQLMTFDYQTGIAQAIVRTHRDRVQDARAAIACVHAIDGQSVGIRVRGVSGTVRGCEEKYLGRGTEAFPENTVVFDGAERPAVVRGAGIDVRVGEAYIGATKLDLE